MSFLDPFKGIANCCCYYLLKHKLGAVCKGGNHKNCRSVKQGSKQLPEGRPRGGISSPQDGWDFLLPLDGAISRGCAYPIHGCGRTKHGRSWQQPAMMTAGELVPEAHKLQPKIPLTAPRSQALPGKQQELGHSETARWWLCWPQGTDPNLRRIKAGCSVVV